MENCLRLHFSEVDFELFELGRRRGFNLIQYQFQFQYRQKLQILYPFLHVELSFYVLLCSAFFGQIGILH